jgi:putative ABC transport system permease protein
MKATLALVGNKATRGHIPAGLRWRTMAGLGMRMCFHDPARAIGTTFGVVFALVLTVQNLATLTYLIRKNTMFIDHSGAQLFVVPPGTQELAGGAMLPSSVLMQSRACPGVAWASPLIWGNAAIKLPTGGAQPVVLVGTQLPELRGGPWNMVAGDPRLLASPDAMIFEDSERERLGGLNLGDYREVNSHRVQVAGFTWGLLPFTPSLSFAEYDTARTLLEIPSDRLNYVIVGIDPEADVFRVQRELQGRIPEATVMRADEIRETSTHVVLYDQGIGLMILSVVVIDLLIGFAIVSLAMFTSVLENIREFATMKAMGATTLDLGKLLFTQSLVFAAAGSCLGMTLMCSIVWLARSANYDLILEPRTVASSVALIVALCISASLLALTKLRSVEPAMVFR